MYEWGDRNLIECPFVFKIFCIYCVLCVFALSQTNHIFCRTCSLCTLFITSSQNSSNLALFRALLPIVN